MSNVEWSELLVFKVSGFYRATCAHVSNSASHISHFNGQVTARELVHCSIHILGILANPLHEPHKMRWKGSAVDLLRLLWIC